MAVLELEEIQRLVEIKKGGQTVFALQIHDPSAGVLLAVNEVQLRQNDNQKKILEILSKVDSETNEQKKSELNAAYSQLEKTGMEISFEFIKCMVKNYSEIEKDLMYMNINYLGQLVQLVQEEFQKTKDSKKKLVPLSKKNSGELNLEKQAM